MLCKTDNDIVTPLDINLSHFSNALDEVPLKFTA
jgi:hypothetical protein